MASGPENDAMMTQTGNQDSSLRFIFDDADIRGEWVRLDEALHSINSAHAYSKSTRILLGQFAIAAVLISNNLKYQGKIVLQAKSAGPLNLLMVECTSDGEIRGIARGDIAAVADDPMNLIPEGQLVITIERNGGQRYQGIVPLDDESLARSLDHYFLQSEQLNTRFWLFADGTRAAGIMLQQLPAQIRQDAGEREKQWQEAEILAGTATADELYSLEPAAMLHRLYHEQTVRVFEPQPVVFCCSCSRERSLNALGTLAPSELDEIFEEQGVIDMTCEMCGTPYTFDRNDLSGLAEPPILH